MGMTVIDLHPLTDRLMGLIAEGKWAEANEQAELMLKLIKEICKHTAFMAEG